MWSIWDGERTLKEGDRRYDVMMEPKSKSDNAVIMDSRSGILGKRPL